MRALKILLNRTFIILLGAVLILTKQTFAVNEKKSADVVTPATPTAGSTDNIIFLWDESPNCGSVSAKTIWGSTVQGGDCDVYLYQWQYRLSSTSEYIDIAGAKSSSYNAPAISQTTYYRRRVTGGDLYEVSGLMFYTYGQCVSYSNEVVRTVIPSLSGNSAGASVSYCEPADPALLNGSRPYGGNGTYSYQWQHRLDDFDTWDNIPGATAEDYDPPFTHETFQCRRIVTSGRCTSTSSIVIVRIDMPVSNNVLPAGANFCTSIDPPLIVGSTPIGGSGTYFYRWQQTTGGSWATISGATGKDYDPPLISSSTSYRRIASSGACMNFASNSTDYTLLVPPAPQQISPSVWPPVVCTSGGVLRLQVEDYGGRTYQWKKDGVDIPWANSNVYSIDAAYNGDSAGVYNYSVEISNGCVSTSGPIAVTIEPPIDNNIIGEGYSEEVYCDPPLIIGSEPTGGGGSYTYQWKVRTESEQTWTDIPGAVNRDYDPPYTNSVGVYYYQRVVMSTCDVSMGEVLSITVHSCQGDASARIGYSMESLTTNVDQKQGAEDMNLVVYPNPAKDEITVQKLLDESDDVQINIENTLGHIAYKQQQKSMAGVYRKTIDISSFAAGIYMVKMKTGKGVDIKRLVITH